MSVSITSTCLLRTLKNGDSWAACSNAWPLFHEETLPNIQLVLVLLCKLVLLMKAEAKKKALSTSVSHYISSEAPSSVDSLTTNVRKISSTHSRNLLVCFFSIVLYFQETSGKLKSHIRRSSSKHKTSSFS